MIEQPHQFELLETIGRGGFGTVYRARFIGESGFAKEVALKVLHRELEDQDEVARRLRDEARVLGLLRHRAIVQVDRLTRVDGRWTIVMEYIEGRSISQILRHGTVPPAAAVEIVGEVAGALHAAWHRRGPSGAPLCLVHRDIKPSNIQLTTQGEVKVLDFGIARAEFESREAETRSLAFGTLEYMAPERLDGQGDGPQGDIYALGVLMYESIMGVNFGRTSARRERHEPRMVVSLQALSEVQGVTEPLVELVTDLLSWSPQARPTANQVERRCAQLRAGLEGDSLRVWTEQVVIPLMALPADEAEGPGASGDDLVGTILMDRSQPTPQGEDATRWERAESGDVDPRRRRSGPLPELADTATVSTPEAPTVLVMEPPDHKARAQPGKSSAVILVVFSVLALSGALWQAGKDLPATAGAEAPSSIGEPPSEPTRIEASQLDAPAGPTSAPDAPAPATGAAAGDVSDLGNMGATEASEPTKGTIASSVRVPAGFSPPARASADTSSGGAKGGAGRDVDAQNTAQECIHIGYGWKRCGQTYYPPPDSPWSGGNEAAGRTDVRCSGRQRRCAHVEK